MKCIETFIIVLAILTLTACSTDPEETNQEVDLVIENGFYRLTNDTIGSKTYTIHFNYFVTGTVCYIDGLSMTLNDSVIVNEYWDMWKELVPGQTYYHEEVVRMPYYISRGPTVTLQGYTKGKSYADPKLKESFILTQER
ncbi:MAG: hypothetical protein ABSB78_02160 [Bacteroidota bacterium]